MVSNDSAGGDSCEEATHSPHPPSKADVVVCCRNVLKAMGMYANLDAEVAEELRLLAKQIEVSRACRLEWAQRMGVQPAQETVPTAVPEDSETHPPQVDAPETVEVEEAKPSPSPRKLKKGKGAPVVQQTSPTPRSPTPPEAEPASPETEPPTSPESPEGSPRSATEARKAREEQQLKRKQ
eukprot:Sspe_Gene.63820::Locus_36987_Transcript_1_1_Confidence_1.000_Length_1627::g.63820::m.63820